MLSPRLSTLTAFALLALVPTPAASAADIVTATEGWSVDPSAISLTLSEGEELTEALTVHIPVIVSTDTLDVYLLTDSTGSMGGAINGVKGSAVSLVSDLFADMEAAGVDLRVGVGNYKDFPDDDTAFHHQLSPVGAEDADSVVDALMSWKAGGGGDGPEATFYAFHQLANDVSPDGGSIGWRDGSSRVLIWIGDAPAHDPVCAALTGLDLDLDEALVTDELIDAGVTVMAVSTSSWYPGGLNGDPASASTDYTKCGDAGGSAGQATRITEATGGISTSLGRVSAIASRIQTLVEMPISGIDTLTVTPSAEIAPYVLWIDPDTYYDLDTMVEQDLSFNVTYLGACSDDGETVLGTLDVVADGVVVAQQEVSLSLPSCSAPPVAVCQDLDLTAGEDCLACGTVDGGSYDPDGGAVSVTELATCDYGLGDTTVELIVTDEDGLTATCEARVTVTDLTPPETESLGAMMWPPNHKSQSFSLSDCAAVTWDNCDEDGLDIDSFGEILSISSDEPEDATGTGDGKTTDDIVITSATTFELRAEREGGGDGRVYTVNYAVEDASGNRGLGSCTVVVPHDMSGRDAVDSGAAAGYTVTR